MDHPVYRRFHRFPIDDIAIHRRYLGAIDDSWFRIRREGFDEVRDELLGDIFPEFRPPIAPEIVGFLEHFG